MNTPNGTGMPAGDGAKFDDVLVVGAGPTGLMLANQLAARGTPVRIIDVNPGPSLETRALGVQARTLEIYAQLGVIDQALALGKPATGADMWSQGRHMAHIPLSMAGSGVTPYPYVLVLGQDDNERILGDRLRGQGVTVERNTELVALEQQPDHVVAWLRGPDGETRPFTTGWVAGCDGAHSAVRKLTGIAFPGAPYEHVFFVADVQATGGMVPDEVNVYLWRSGFHLFFPMRGQNHWRIVGILPKALRDQGEVGFDDVLPSVREQAGPSLQFQACSWFSTYRIHHRRAERFRDGRCFLLGDAAHIHSPVGAQGMNTGLQDAYNLGWKLALVAQGRAQAGLLDSYEAERVPVAQRLLDTTDRAFRLVVSDNPLAGLLRTQVIARLAAALMGSPAVQRRAFSVVSQTGIRYHGSALSRTQDWLPEGGPQAGDRFPWLRLALRQGGPAEDLYQRFGDGQFHLVLIGQPFGPESILSMAGLAQVDVIEPGAWNEAALMHARIPSPSFYLIRPDGHIGLCGGVLDLDELRLYGQECLQLREGVSPEAFAAPRAVNERGR